MEKCVNIYITGHVQGVNFRYHTQKTANSLRIRGFVKNMPDGSVMVEAQGDTSNLEKFIHWCHKGPVWARVDNVEVEDASSCNHDSFQVKY